MRYRWDEARTHYERTLAIIAAKEKALQAAYGTQVSLAQLGELRSQAERLRDLRARVEAMLREIP